MRILLLVAQNSLHEGAQGLNLLERTAIGRGVMESLWRSVTGSYPLRIVGQPTQPIQGAVQGFGQCDQGGNGGPCFAVFDRVQALGAYSYEGRQLARGPSLLLTPGTNPFSQNFFREIHVSPLDRQLLTYVLYRYQL